MSNSYKKWFPSKYLKAEDLGTNRVIGTIDRIELELVGAGKDQTEKPVLYFVEPKLKPLVLNRINSETIEEVAGTDDPEAWPGVRVVLYATKTDFQGKRVGCIRLDHPPARPAAKATPPARTPTAAAKAKPAPPADDTELVNQLDLTDDDEPVI